MDIMINVVNQKLKLTSNLKSFVAGTQEFITFHFIYGEDWADLTTFAQFTQNGNSYNVYLDEEDSCFLPPEIVAGKCTVMLFGTKTTTVNNVTHVVHATTNVIEFTLDENMLIPNASSTEITQTLYDQLVQKVNAVLDLSDSDYSDLIKSEIARILGEYLENGDLAAATIGDGTIEKAKLNASLQSSLDKADNSWQKDISETSTPTAGSWEAIYDPTGYGKRNPPIDPYSFAQTQRDTAIARLNSQVTNLAPAYSASATYALGDFVTHDGKIYKCTTAITTAETWTAGHWTQVNLGSNISDIKYAIAKEYTNDIAYLPGDYVWHDNYLYRCIENVSVGESWTLNKWTRIINTDDIKKIYTDIAPAYSASESYHVGDIVSRGSKFYECRTDIETPESWNSNNWAPIYLADIINGRIAALDTKNQILTHHFNYITGSVIDEWEQGGLYSATGLPYSSANAIRTSFIPVVNNTFSICNFNGVKFGVYEYDSNQAFVKRSNDFLNYKRQYSVGNDTAFIKVQISGTSIDASYAKDFFVYNQAESDLHESEINVSGLQRIFFTTGQYINNSGTSVNISSPINSTNYAYATDVCNEGDRYYILGSGASVARLWSFSDSSGNIIEKANDTYDSNNGYIIVIAPENASLFVCNVKLSADYMVFKSQKCAKDMAIKTLTKEELEFGRIAINTHAFIKTPYFMVTKDFVPHNATCLSVQNENVKVAIIKYVDGKIVGFDYWKTYGTTYNFDFATYDDFKIYFAYSDESIIINHYDLTNGLIFIINDKDQESINSQSSIDPVKKAMYKIMANDYNISYANAAKPLSFDSYLKNSQNVHPKVLYFPNRFGEHYYWMAYTPYPFARDAYENPCIAYSDDGYEWRDIKGNPLDNPGGDGYNSDTHLVYRDDSGILECWYRYVSDYDNPPVSEIIRRRTSTDGITWSEEETIYVNDTGYYAYFLSPAIIWDGEKYNIWVITSSNNTIQYYTALASDITNWNLERTIVLTYKDADNIEYKPWHLDVINDNGTYIMLIMCKSFESAAENRWTMFMTTSDDNTNYETPYVVIYGDPDSWDSYMYRGSIVKVNGEYRIYYSAGSDTYGISSIWGIGVSTSKNLHNFIGAL